MVPMKRMIMKFLLQHQKMIKIKKKKRSASPEKRPASPSRFNILKRFSISSKEKPDLQRSQSQRSPANTVDNKNKQPQGSIAISSSPSFLGQDKEQQKFFPPTPSNNQQQKQSTADFRESSPSHSPEHSKLSINKQEKQDEDEKKNFRITTAT